MLRRLYICAGLSEYSLQLPGGSRGVLFSDIGTFYV